LTASAANPPVETVPATTSPKVAKQNGHMVHLSGGKALIAEPLLIVVTGEVGLFLQGREKKSTPLLEEKLSYCEIFSESDSSVVSLPGFGAFSQALQEMSANRPVGLISRDCALVDCIQNC
jgi:hypothetical protein